MASIRSMLNLSAFQAFIKEHQLFNPEQQVLLAVSGGRDSVLMAHYFKQSAFNFGIAHCNFSLRGKESEAEEQFTATLAAEMDIAFYSTIFDTRGYASENGISLQMAARDLRYQWLEEIRADFGYQYISLAHHQNDTVETMLLNLTRGTGIAGLHGIRPKRNKLIRPLLFLNRNEIDEIVVNENIAFRDDTSNGSTKYARNKIRLKVIPVLKELNPQLENTFLKNAKRFSEMEIILQQKTDKLKQELFQQSKNGEITISIKKISELHPIDLLMFSLFSAFNFTEAVLGDLKKGLKNQSGKIFESISHQITIDRENLFLCPIAKGYESEEILIDLDGEISWNGNHFKSELLPVSAFRNKTNNNIVQLDYHLLVLPLKMRSWRNGDYFYPFGMKGRKKLSNFFIEQKIPLVRKEKIGVLENGNGDILWIAGLRPDSRYKITSKTEKIFILEKQTSDEN